MACHRGGGHPFLEAVINAVLRNIDSYVPERHGMGKRAVLRLAGPIAYTLAIAPLRDAHPHRLIDAEAEGFVYRAVRAARPGSCPAPITARFGRR